MIVDFVVENDLYFLFVIFEAFLFQVYQLMLNLDEEYYIKILLEHIHVENLFQDQNIYMLLMNDHEILLFYYNDLLMMLMVIVLNYLIVIDLLVVMKVMEVMEVELIQQSMKIFKLNK